MQQKFLLCLFVCCLGRLSKAQDLVIPTEGMVITHSITLQPGVYTSTNTHDSIAWLEINGNNLTLDLTGVTFLGSKHEGLPDSYKGIGIRIQKGSSNIRIRHAAIHGFKIGIIADSVRGLVIDASDLGYNYRQALHSNLWREDISDWMSFHHNEQNEWLRYGAAIYLNNCQNASITNNTATGGQCALLMSRCYNNVVADNNFSFNSGLGIGMYRSSNNKVYHNLLDWNVRGYSHGKYRRGQDSAGILVFEQSSNNIFAFNSATHSGDGFFLWAGQHTMDTGEGGSNDNFVYGNDFSYAPTNGAELTFSRNLVMKNLMRDCNHGIWGGYSFESDFTDNDFAFNNIAIAIEHGQNNNIALNRFLYDKTGIKLWSREQQPADWSYARLRNTQSKNYWIAANQFTATETVYDIMGTDTVAFNGNLKMAYQTGLKLGTRTNDIDTSREDDPLDMDYQPDNRLKEIPASKRPEQLLPKGRDQIRITPWGPYDFRYPILWLQGIDSAGNYQFEVLAKQGKWQLANQSGFDIIEKDTDSFPSYLIAKPIQGAISKQINLQYEGPDFINQFGKTQKGPALFGYQLFQPAYFWEVQFYQWDSVHNPYANEAAVGDILKQVPIYQTTTPTIDYTWWGAIGKGLPADSFVTVASTRVHVPAGKYSLGITADDLVKVWVDGKEVINGWDPTNVLYDEKTHHRISLTLSEGTHEIKLLHVEKTGLATLMFYLDPL